MLDQENDKKKKKKKIPCIISIIHVCYCINYLFYKTNEFNPSIVLCKMFSRWFFANKKLIITIRTSKFGDVTYNVMS